MYFNPLSPTRWTQHPNSTVLRGGGGGDQTSTSGVPEWLRPQIEKAANAATGLYDSGGLTHVEGLTPEQQDAYNRKLELGQQGGMLDQLGADSYGAAGAYRDAASGKGLFGANALGDQITSMKDTIGDAQMSQLGQLQGAASMGGGLGSARSQAMNSAALSKTAGEMGAAELANRRASSLSGAQGVIGSGDTIGGQMGQGIKATEGVGSAIQQQKQNEADAGYQGIQRLFGLYGSPAIGQQTVSSGGGGK
tara:strand:- start:337 stop:1086 length:750 start_codon:yes stop_codon:yes gene_type:complete